MTNEYEERIKKREEANRQESNANQAASEASEGKTNLADTASGIGGQQVQQGVQSGNSAQTLGGGLMMTGDPVLMATGLGLNVLAAGEQNRRAQEEAQRQAYNQRIRDRQAMMAQIAQMGIQ